VSATLYDAISELPAFS